MSDAEQLGKIRDRIDAIDEQVHQLLNQRAEAAMEVARIKLAADPNAVFYRPEREAQVLRMVQERNKGPLDDEEVARLFREIMSACLALERPLQIAYLGPAGTFTQAAALKHFGHSVRTEPLGSIPDVFLDVESGKADYGVVPVENSTEGVVNHTPCSLNFGQSLNFSRLNFSLAVFFHLGDGGLCFRHVHACCTKFGFEFASLGGPLLR